MQMSGAAQRSALLSEYIKIRAVWSTQSSDPHMHTCILWLPTTNFSLRRGR